MSKYFLRFIIGFICFLSANQLLAQGTSNKGTDFWLGYGNHISTGYMVLYLTSDVNTTAKVSISSLGFNQTVNISANTVIAVDIPKTAHLANEGLSSNGIHVTSLKPIIVYAHIYQTSVSGATLVLPVNTLGKDYYSINFKQLSNSANSQSYFFVVAVEDDTQVEITPSADTENWSANTTHVVSLKKGEIYNVLGKSTNSTGGSYGVDLTGSKVKSISSNGTCKKIAVFSGSSKVSINCLSYDMPNSRAPGAADNLFQQAYPTSAWGKSFITVPLKERDFSIYRIVKSDPTASVYLNGKIINNSYFINDFYYDFENRYENRITSDKPIQVVQYAVTQGKTLECGSKSGDIGDPEMIFLNPLEQTLTQITMYSTPRYSIIKHFINIVVKNEGVASFKLDGVNVSGSFSPVSGSSTHSYAQLSVNEGTHNLVSDEGFNATAYGFGNNESYGYAAGANLTAFGLESVTSVTSESVQAGCLNNNYDIRINLPYQTADLYLDKLDGNGYQSIPVNLIGQNTTAYGITYTYEVIKNIKSLVDTTLSFKVKSIKPTIDDCGSGDEFDLDFIIYSKPIADFSVTDKVCLNSTLKFTFTKNANQTITNYLWDFNGEGTSTLENPEFTFATAGIKKVKLMVKSSLGCWSDSYEKDVEILSLPQADFLVDKNCVNQELIFSNNSTSASGKIVKWQWDFGDPQSTDNLSDYESPVHIFSEVKKYTIKLTVTTEFGCTNTITKQIKINAVPNVDFKTPDICLSDASATFENVSSVSDNSTLTYLWDFGDPTSGNNNSSTLKSPTHIYKKAQVYNVSLTVTAANGCTTTLTKSFTVNGSTPKADFLIENADKLCVTEPVSFQDNASVDFGEITKIEWIFDNAQPHLVETDDKPNLRAESKKIYKHTYPVFYSPAQKKVIVSMRAYSGLTCVNTVEKEITLKAIPKADFLLPNSCLNNGEAQFINTSTFDGSETGLTYLWSFGDDNNTTSKLKNPVIKFSSAKSYIISLTVTATNGCSQTISKTFAVTGATANPNFEVANANNLCSNSEVVFTEKSTLAFGELSKVEWFFDTDNQVNNPAYQITDNSPNKRNNLDKVYTFNYPVFNAPISKNINVKMRATSSGGCVNEIIKTLTLKAVPNVVFESLNPVCAEVAPYRITQAKETTGFKGSGFYSGKGITSDGLFSPALAGAGEHTITYTYTGENLCSVTKSQTLEVFPTPILDAGTDKIILTGGEAILDAVASGKNLQYKWTPSIGLSRDDILNPIASPLKDITYVLTITSDDGCVSTDEVNVKVLQFPVIKNTFTPNGDGVNDTWAIEYLESYPDVSIKILNRYGKEVYKAESYQHPWDGKFNGEDLPQGMYYYIITAKKGELKYTGSVLIVR